MRSSSHPRDIFPRQPYSKRSDESSQTMRSRFPTDASIFLENLTFGKTPKLYVLSVNEVELAVEKAV